MFLVLIWKKIFITLKENHFPNKVVHSILMFLQAAGEKKCSSVLSI